jgi:hypothetical protein
MKLLTIALLCLPLAACGGRTAMTDFTKHLNERNCATTGNVTGAAGLTGTSIGGHVEWDCSGGKAGEKTEP